jgi:hypothetical protein
MKVFEMAQYVSVDKDRGLWVVLNGVFDLFGNNFLAHKAQGAWRVQSPLWAEFVGTI